MCLDVRNPVFWVHDPARFKPSCLTTARALKVCRWWCIDKLGVFHAIQISMCLWSLGLSPPVKYFTDRSKVVLLLWIFYAFVLSCVCYVFVHVCLYVLCCQRLGKGWPLGSRLWCLTVSFSLSWVRCGTWLYRSLIFAPLLTLSCIYLYRFMQAQVPERWYSYQHFIRCSWLVSVKYISKPYFAEEFHLHIELVMQR